MRFIIKYETVYLYVIHTQNHIAMRSLILVVFTFFCFSNVYAQSSQTIYFSYRGEVQTAKNEDTEMIRYVTYFNNRIFV